MTSFRVDGRRAQRRGVRLSSALGAALLSTIGAAHADDLTIANGTTVTDPVFTSTAANGSPGNVTVETGAEITLDSADTDPAITLDSGAATVTNAGTIKAASANQVGIAVTAATTGGVVNSGGITTGTQQVTDSDGNVTTAAVGGGPGILVQADLTTGLNNTGTVTTTASSTNPYAVLVESNGAPVTLGNIDASDADLAFSMHNSSNIYSYAYDSSVSAIALGFRGDAVNAVTLTGVNNAGVIEASAVDNDATAIDIGQYATLGDGSTTGLLNSGTIYSVVAGETVASTVTAIHVDANAALNKIDNSGSITATASGTAGADAVTIDVEAGGSLAVIDNSGSISAVTTTAGKTATAIRDASGSLATIDNTDSIIAVATDTGQAVALDLSSALANTVVTNSGTITGDILLGGGTYQVDSSSGTITSAIEVDGGSSSFNLSGDAILKASSTLTSGGTLALTVQSGATLQTVDAGFNTTTATFESGSILGVTYDTATGTQGGILKADTATLHDGTVVNVQLSSYLGTATPTITLVETSTALNLDTPADPSGLVIGGIGAGYNAIIALANSDADLTVTLSRKTAGQLDLNANVASIYNAAVTALEADTTFGAAVGNLGTVDEVRALYTSLLPDLSGARERQALRVQDISAGFVNDRLSLMRTAEQGGGDGGGTYPERFRRAGFWAQQSASREEGEGGDGSQPYSGTLYAFAVGYDARDRDGDVWGGSFTYTAMNYAANGSSDGNLNQSSVAQVYHSINRGPVFWDMVGALGWNSYDSNRVVTAGSVTRETSASWSGYQAGLSSQVGYAAMFSPISVRPSVGASYTFLEQQGYDEKGGGTGVDLSVDSNSFQSLRANAELRITGLFGRDPQYVPFIRGGISHELLDARAEASGHFVAGGSGFSLQGDELDKDVPFVGAGFSVVGGYSRVSLAYTAQLGDKFTSHQAVGTFALMF